MTAQDAFQNWLIYASAIGACLVVLAFGVAIVVVGLSPKRDK
jgi:hypothetical protein